MKKTLNINGHLFDLSTPMVMGILNATPDSFYDKSRIGSNKKSLLTAINKMVADGVDIIDIGGYSTRPGADDISIAEEIKRVLPVIKLVKGLYPQIPISIDTFRSEVAEAAVSEGADIVNDISGGTLDKKMPLTVASLRVPYILMHNRGTPKGMQTQVIYQNVVTDVLTELQQRVLLFEEKGVRDIIVDVGFGFAKSTDHNFELLNSLEFFQNLNRPLLIGVSRKSMIYKTLKNSPQDALNGTTALHMFALTKGANLLRVHDVKEAVECRQLMEYI
ncbi:MAG: dihydropteroate synthase, partial [Spirosomaceae bacterium]|nr:dihydropteroate synthase [Spirosomataceae bacterium]